MTYLESLYFLKKEAEKGLLDIFALLPGVFAALSFMQIAGFNFNYPPFRHLFDQWGYWAQEFWKLVSFVDISLSAAALLTLYFVSVSVAARGIILNHPSAWKVMFTLKEQKGWRSWLSIEAVLLLLSFSLVHELVLKKFTEEIGFPGSLIAMAIPTILLFSFPRNTFAIVWGLLILVIADFLGASFLNG